MGNDRSLKCMSARVGIRMSRVLIPAFVYMLMCCGCGAGASGEPEDQKPEDQELVTAIEQMEITDVMNDLSEAELADTNALDTDTAFYISEIPDDIFEKMQGKSYREDCTVSRDELRYIHVLHVGFDGEDHEGEIVCGSDIAEDILDIFKELYKERYEIEKIRLVDEYNGDDEASMADNNTSCFNFRFISHTTRISKHGQGIAIDINPLYNPYVKTVDGRLSIEPANGEPYVDRVQEFPHKIEKGDLCYSLFARHGFEWGGEWKNSKDYQHFEKKY